MWMQVLHFSPSHFLAEAHCCLPPSGFPFHPSLASQPTSFTMNDIEANTLLTDELTVVHNLT